MVVFKEFKINSKMTDANYAKLIGNEWDMAFNFENYSNFGENALSCFFCSM